MSTFIYYYYNYRENIVKRLLHYRPRRYMKHVSDWKILQQNASQKQWCK